MLNKNFLVLFSYFQNAHSIIIGNHCEKNGAIRVPISSETKERKKL